MKRAARPRLPLSTILAIFISAQFGTGHLTAQPFVFRDVASQSGLIPAAAGIQGHGAGWGDVDGDGWPDIYIGTFHYKGTQPNLLLINRKGRFQLDDQASLRISTRATGVVFADFEGSARSFSGQMGRFWPIRGFVHFVKIDYF